MRIVRLFPTLSALLLAAALPCLAQAPEQQPSAPPSDANSGPVLHTRANASETAPTKPAVMKEISLLAVVRDKKGNQITTLGKDDFILEQDGHPQTVTAFANNADTPMIFGILADTGPGQRKELGDERKFSTAFVNRLLREGTDKGFVLHFDKQVELLQDVSTSHDRLARAIDEIAVGERAQDSSSGNGRRRDDAGNDRQHFYFGGGLLFDAIFLTSNEILKGQKGRKVAIIFSDGEDRDSHEGVAEAIEAAQRADLALYTVWVPSEREQREQQPRQGGGRHGGGFPGGGGGWPGGGGGSPRGGNGRGEQGGETKEQRERAKQQLQRIAKETGGRYFESSKKETAEQIYTQIEDELRHQYRLAYTPTPQAGYHKLVLKTKNGDYTVQTREGFYGD